MQKRFLTRPGQFWQCPFIPNRLTVFRAFSATGFGAGRKGNVDDARGWQFLRPGLRLSNLIWVGFKLP